MDFLYTFLSKLGIMNRVMPPINQAKVNQFLSQWNTGRPANNPLWIEIFDTYALMKMDISANNSVTFQNNYGFPVKIFKNTENSEIRIFDARRFT